MPNNTFTVACEPLNLSNSVLIASYNFQKLFFHTPFCHTHLLTGKRRERGELTLFPLVLPLLLLLAA